jgi:hypothetical protein
MFLKIHYNTQMLKSVPHELYLAGRVVSKSPPKKFHSKYVTTIFLCHGPLPFKPYHLFCVSHHKTRWTMSMDYVGLKICLMGTSTSMVTLTIFPWCKRKWVLGRAEQPINALTRPWDNFMVHGVNNPLP